MNSGRRIAPGSGKDIVAVPPNEQEVVRQARQCLPWADIGARPYDVRFTPKSGHH